MQVYFYARSGHTVGLEATKRCAAVASILKDLDPILCTSDFRAGAFAKDNLDVRRYVNIDVVRNLHNIMARKDILLFDTDETNELMEDGMSEYCSLVFNLKEISDIIVDTSLYTKNDNPSIQKTLFFGDDDYDNLLLEEIKDAGNFDVKFLMGHYLFLGNEKEYAQHFNEVIDEEEYVDTINNSKFLLTGSLQSALESIQCGNSPVIFKRKDKIYNEELISELNIPLIETKSLEETIKDFDTICENYPEIKNFKIADLSQIKETISKKVEAFKSLTE